MTTLRSAQPCILSHSLLFNSAGLIYLLFPKKKTQFRLDPRSSHLLTSPEKHQLRGSTTILHDHVRLYYTSSHSVWPQACFHHCRAYATLRLGNGQKSSTRHRLCSGTMQVLERYCDMYRGDKSSFQPLRRLPRQARHRTARGRRGCPPEVRARQKRCRRSV